MDTPGLHRPRTLLGKRLNDLVADTLAEVDAIGFCLPANEKIGPGDKYIAEQLAQCGRQATWALVTKTDLVDRQALAEQLIAVAALGTGGPGRGGLGRRRAGLRRGRLPGGHRCHRAGGHMPPSPPLYPDGELTDEPEAVMVAELIREAALEGVRDELPHSLAVVVEEIVPREGRPENSPLLDVRVNLYVERPSQKAIIIGKGGARLREVGTNARRGHRGAAGHPDLPGPPCEGRQGLAAGPQTAGQARFLAQRARRTSTAYHTAFPSLGDVELAEFVVSNGRFIYGATPCR